MTDIRLWVLICALILMIAALTGKILLLRKAAKEIEEAFVHRLTADTNTLIDISCRDRQMCSLAAAVNTQLRALRADELRFRQGDYELKSAVTNISHDLRTPLTAIYGYLNLLEDEDMSEEARSFLKIIRNRADMMKQLTEELFQYSVIINTQDRITNSPVVINEVLEESVAAFYAAFKERRITPLIRMPETKVVRSLDRGALSRIFSNLLSNVIRYGDGDLEICLSEKDGITFSNKASGLNKVQAERLFGRFFTVNGAGKSTGLGLDISRTLTERMGGFTEAFYENGRLHIRVFFPEDGASRLRP